MLRLLGASEVTDQQRDAMIFGTDTRRQCRCFIDGNSKAVHARIDVQRRTAVPLISRAECVPLREFDETANHRLSTDIGEGCRSSRQQTVEHIKCGVWSGGARPPCLRYICNKECPATRICESARDRLDAAAIPVGFNDCGAL